MRLRRLSEFSRGDFLAACGGEMRSNYFKNGAPKSADGALLGALFEEISHKKALKVALYATVAILGASLVQFVIGVALIAGFIGALIFWRVDVCGIMAKVISKSFLYG